MNDKQPAVNVVHVQLHRIRPQFSPGGEGMQRILRRESGGAAVADNQPV